MPERPSAGARADAGRRADGQGGAAYTFHDHAPAPDNFREAALHGLAQPQKAIPFRFLYDAAGSRLFEQICRQPEYYITRTELDILEDHAGDIARRVGPGAQLVELGSGAGIKVERLLQALPDPAAYIAVEISRPALLAAVQRPAGRNCGARGLGLRQPLLDAAGTARPCSAFSPARASATCGRNRPAACCPNGAAAWAPARTWSSAPT